MSTEIIRTSDPAGAERLRAAGRVRRPGIVAIQAGDDGDDETSATVWVWPPFEGVVDAHALHLLAAALADLHTAGVTHGSITSAALRADPAGHPALPLPSLHGGAVAPEDDIAALGHLVPPGAPEGLARLAARMTDRDPVRRPTAAEVVAQLAHTIHPRVLPRPRRSLPRPRWRLRPRQLVAVAALAAGGLALAFAAAAADAPRPTLTVRPLPPETTVRPPAPAPTIPASTARVVMIDDRRYELGEPGDLVVAGDLLCNGTPVVALVRPGATGAIFLFAKAADGATAEPAAYVANATGAGRRPTASGCDELVVDTSDDEQPVSVNLREGGPPPRSPGAAPPP